jgi:hypothetical protein
VRALFLPFFLVISARAHTPARGTPVSSPAAYAFRLPSHPHACVSGLRLSALLAARRGNDLGYDGIEALADGLRHVQQLQELHLSCALAVSTQPASRV